MQYICENCHRQFDFDDIIDFCVYFPADTGLCNISTEHLPGKSMLVGAWLIVGNTYFYLILAGQFAIAGEGRQDRKTSVQFILIRFAEVDSFFIVDIHGLAAFRVSFQRIKRSEDLRSFSAIHRGMAVVETVKRSMCRPSCEIRFHVFKSGRRHNRHTNSTFLYSGSIIIILRNICDILLGIQSASSYTNIHKTRNI